MNRYDEMKSRQQKRIENLLSKRAFFAFSNEQYKQGLQKLGMDEDDAVNELRRIPGGGYLLEEYYPDFKAILEKNDREIKAALNDPITGPYFAFDMFYSELKNHEYSYTGDSTETLESLGMTFETVEENPILSDALDAARRAIAKDPTEEEPFNARIVTQLQGIQNDVYELHNLESRPYARKWVHIVLEMADRINNEVKYPGMITQADLDQLTTENFHTVRRAAELVQKIFTESLANVK